MSKQYDPASGQQVDFRPELYPDDQNQNPKSGGGGTDGSFQAPGFEGYDTMNPPSINQIRGLSDSSSAPANNNLNPSTSGAISTVPQGTTRGASLGGAAGQAISGQAAKYGMDKLKGLTTTARGNGNDTSVFQPSDGASVQKLYDGASGTERGAAGQALGDDGVQVNGLSETTPVNGTPLAGDGDVVAGAADSGAGAGAGLADASTAADIGEVYEGGEAVAGAAGLGEGLAAAGTAAEIGEVYEAASFVETGLEVAAAYSVVCYELVRTGHMHLSLADASSAFAKNLNPAIVRGYHHCCPFLLRVMRTKPWAHSIIKYLATKRSLELKEGNHIGKLVRLVLEPVAYVIGKTVGAHAPLRVKMQESLRQGRLVT